MLAVLILALSKPEMGKVLDPERMTSTAAVVLIFLLTGFSLPTEAIKEGVTDIRLHAYIQLFIFVITPLYFFLTAFPFREVMNGHLIVGIYALDCLPTTISTCVVFTQLTGGNVVGTLFNSAFANTIGIFISPLLLTLFLQKYDAGLPFSELLTIFRNLIFQMLLPAIVGQFFIGFL